MGGLAEYEGDLRIYEDRCVRIITCIIIIVVVIIITISCWAR